MYTSSRFIYDGSQSAPFKSGTAPLTIATTSGFQVAVLAAQEGSERVVQTHRRRREKRRGPAEAPGDGRRRHLRYHKTVTGVALGNAGHTRTTRKFAVSVQLFVVFFFSILRVFVLLFLLFAKSYSTSRVSGHPPYPKKTGGGCILAF